MDRLRWTLIIVAVLAASVAAQAQEAGDAELTAATQLVTQHKYADAVPALSRFVEQFPKHPHLLQARLRLGEALLASEHPDTARTQYELVLAAKPAKDLEIEAQIGLGRCLLALKSEQKALEPLTLAFEATAQDSALGPAASLAYGEALLRLERYPDAVRAFDRVTQWPMAAEASRAYFMVGEANRRAGNFQEAAVTFHNVADKYWRLPVAPEASLLAGDSYLAIQKYDEAEAEYRRVLKDYLESSFAPRAQLGLGMVAYRRGNYSSARSAFTAASLVFAASGIGPEAELRVADCYRAEHNDAEAKSRYTTLAASSDRAIAGEAQFTLAKLLEDERELGKASATYERLGEQKDTGRWSHLGRMRLAELRFGSGDPTAAFSLLRSVLAETPEASIRDDAQYLLGTQLAEKSDWAGSEHELAELVHRSPKSRTVDGAEITVARCRLEQKDAAGAAARTELLLKRELPAALRPAALEVSGRALLALKKTDAGSAALQEILDKYPDSASGPVAARVLLDHYRDSRQDARAEQVEKLIAQRYGGKVVAVDGILDQAAAQAGKGRFEEALRLYRQVLDARPARAGRLKARAGIAEASAALKQDAEVDSQLAEIERDGPGPGFLASVRLRVAVAEERAGQRPAAARQLRNALTAGPDAADTPKILVHLCRLLPADDPESSPLLHRVLDQYPSSPEVADALYALAWWEAEHKNPDGSRELFTRLVHDYAAHPLAADAAFRLAETEFRASDLAAAAGHYRLAAASTAAVADRAGYKLGWTLRKQKDREGAARAFREVSERFPKSGLALECRVRAGEALLDLERDKDAAEQFNRVLEGASDDSLSELQVQARVGLAMAYLQGGDFDKARAAAEAASRPTYGWYGGRAVLVRADALFMKSGAKAAAPEYSRAAVLFGRFHDLAAEAAFHAGECFQKSHDEKAARAAWQKILQLYPDTDWAARSREKLDSAEAAPRAER